MAVIISLLRAINVGGHSKIKMDALRTVYRSLHLEQPTSYVQSGNVVFKTSESNLPKLAADIEDAVEKTFKIRPSIILRTAAEWREIAARNPFASRDDINGSKLSVTFLATSPEAENRTKALAVKRDGEELHMHNRELYIYFPNGMGRSKLSMATVERALKTPATSRNWNTVLKLLAMAEEIEAS